jgi:hypothetical protein
MSDVHNSQFDAVESLLLKKQLNQKRTFQQLMECETACHWAFILG